MIYAGEAHTNDDESANNVLKNVVNNVYTEVDVSGVLTGIAADDYVAIGFYSDTNNIRVMGFRFKYS